VIALGRFETTPVKQIEPSLVHAANSIYQILLIKKIEILTENRTAA